MKSARTLFVVLSLSALVTMGADCGQECGNGVCEDGETNYSCPSDCRPECGDGHCGQGESTSSCPQDCLSQTTCDHDGDCERGENSDNCPWDCPEICNGDGDCDPGESYEDCPRECPPPVFCNRDGNCDPGENNSSCPYDCPPEHDPFCGDNSCDTATGENANNCYDDCGRCGDRFCNGPETVFTCDLDCTGYCGDGFCEFGEDGWCFNDCGCGGDFPVDCGDGTGCWTAGTNCSSNAFSCGGNMDRCGRADAYANCCNGVFASCPASTPYWCPSTNLCYGNNNYPYGCNEGCTTFGWPCS